VNKQPPLLSSKLLPELLDNLDFGLLLGEIDSLKIIEYNQVFSQWFNEIPSTTTISG